MQTVEDIFNEMGSTGAAAKVMNVKQSAASEMRRRRSIPVRYWPQIIEWAKTEKKPIDSDTLVAVHVQPEAAA